MISHPALRILFILLLALLPFWVVRTALLIHYEQIFASLSVSEILMSYLYGLRFDMSAIVNFVGIPLLLVSLPFAWARARWWQGLWHWCMFAAVLLSVLSMIGDFVYFGFVSRHVGGEIALLGGDPDLMQDIVFNEYGWALLLFIMAAAAGAWQWHRWFSTPVRKSQAYLRRLAIVLGLFVVFVAISRGGLQSKPVGMANAFALGSPASGYLAMNGAFAVQMALIDSVPEQIKYLPVDQARELLRQQVAAGNDRFVSDEYPVMRDSKASFSPTQPPNVVIIAFESWDAAHTDVLRELVGKEALGATPVFGELARQGRLFTNFYANGRRSVEGMAALLGSMVTPPKLPYIGMGMEQSYIHFLGHLAQEEGYATLMLQSSKRGSFQMDAIGATAGFEQYYGAEDIPEIAGHSEQVSDWGVWDYQTFMYANELFARQEKPFLSFIFTSTTHNPWRVPSSQWDKYPLENDLNRYLNTLGYADWALGQFLEEAKKAGYYDNTIFFFTGDHIGRFGVSPNDPKARYQLPLLVLGPGIEPGLDSRIGSQLDVLPSVADLAGWDIRHGSLGRSLFSGEVDPERGVFAVNGSMIEWLSDQGTVTHSREKRIASQGVNVDELERRLLATQQIVLEMLLTNKVMQLTK